MPLSPEEYERAIELFQRARTLRGDERERFLAATSTDEDVLSEVRALLAELDVLPDDGASEDSPAGTKEQRIGPFRLVERLGEGGMGTVWLAEQEAPIRRRVAVKVIRPGLDSDAVLARFEAERQALARMEHASVARVFEAGSTADGRPYFVMEYVAGEPITAFADRERLSIPDRLRLFLQVASAVEHAHQKGIIHRDLKPSNILVAKPEGEPIVKVIDFGIAKSLDEPLSEGPGLTLEGQLVGTPEYMSPEQATGTVRDLDTRSDIYSLGLILHELVVGVLPFDRRALLQGGLGTLLWTIANAEPSPPSERLRSLGGDLDPILERRRTGALALERALRSDLDWIVLRALEKDRSRRYAAVSELSADVERYLRSEPVLARRTTWLYRLGKFGRRHRRQLAATGVVLALLAVIGVAAARFSAERARSARTTASRDLLARGDSEWEGYRDGKGELASLEERWHALARSNPRWAPVWQRAAELAAWTVWRESHREFPRRFHRSHLLFQRALESSLDDSPERDRARGALFELYVTRFRELWWGEAEAASPDWYAGFVEMLGNPDYVRRFEAVRRAKILLSSDPPGARVSCYEHVFHEGRLLPLAWHPEGGAGEGRIAGEPFLRIERIWDDRAGPLHEGDRIVTIAGSSAHTLTDFVSALSTRTIGEPIDLEVLRSGERIALEWLAGGEVRGSGESRTSPAGAELAFPTHDAIRTQLGFTLEAFPLEASAGFVGETTDKNFLELELPEGSWLLVFQKEGFIETRVPLSAPRLPGAREEIHVELLREDEVPEGFVPIPAGICAVGGDDEVHQALPLSYPRVGGFLAGRCEVKFAEYLEFLNDEEDRATRNLEADGTADAELELVRSILAERGRDDGRFQMVPLSDRTGRPLLTSENGRFRLPANEIQLDWPVFGVPLVAAMEYANWLSRKHGGRWRFRVPTDVEWEKMARGVDRRTFVWGDYPVWGFARSSLGERGPRYSPASVGAYPTDESVYGVHDLAGNVEEVTVDRAGGIFHSVRGGDWYTWNDYSFRIANRNGAFAEKTATSRGFRLVADWPKRASE